MKTITNLCVMLLSAFVLMGQSVSVTYTDGDIETDRDFISASGYSDCPGELTITIPEGNWITGVDVTYTMTASGGGYISEQRSRLYSPTTGQGEPDYYSGSGSSGGTFSYARTGLGFANHAAGDVVFQMHAGRNWGGSGCGTNYNKVDNNSWVITAYYEPVPSCPPAANLFAGEITANSALLSWNPLVAGQTYNLKYGSPGFDPEVEGTLVENIETTTFLLDGLDSFTWYEFYIRAVCSTKELSDWSAPYSFRTLPVAMAGNYTINSANSTSGTNFNNFSDFADMINIGGVAGAVNVEVIAGSGPYEEQIELFEIEGMSDVNSLTIVGNNETLQFGSINSEARATLKLNGTDHVHVQNLNILALGEDVPWSQPTEYGWAVHLCNAANHNTFTDCHFVADLETTSIKFAAFVAANSNTYALETGFSAENLTLENCVFQGGFYGVVIIGPTSSPYPVNNKMINCEILDFHEKGLHLAEQTDPLISGNYFSRANRTSSTDIEVITLKYNMHGGTFTNNIITDLSGTTILNGATGFISTGLKAPSTNPMLFANNLITGFRNINGFQTGFSIKTLSGAQHVNIYHNTVLLDNENYTGDADVHCLFHNGNSATLNIKNNIFSYTTPSSGQKANMYFNSFPLTINSNNNVLHRGTPVIEESYAVFWTSSNAFETLADWQAYQSGAYDQQSSDADPLFINPQNGDLMPTNDAVDNMGADLLAVVPEDILGMPRTTTPDPGVYEFEAADCLRPSGLFADNIGEYDVTLSWTANGGEASWNIEWGEAGFEQGEGTLIESASDNPYLLSGLNHSTYYEFYVQAICGGRSTSYWSGPKRFLTQCGAIETPAMESFDDVNPPNWPVCWSTIFESTSNYALLELSSDHYYSPPHSANLYNYNDLTANLMLITPEVGTNRNNLNVGFMARGRSNTILEIGTFSDENIFTLITTINLTTAFTFYSIPIPEEIRSNQRIAFRHGAAGYYQDIYLDDIVFWTDEDEASIAGLVSDNTGEFVEEARIYTGSFETISDSSGYYSFSDLFPKTYDVFAEAGGYGFEHETIDLTPGENANLDLVFQYSNPKLPYQPQLLSAEELPFDEDAWLFVGAAANGQYAYVPMNNDRLYVYDYEIPAAPVKLGSIPIPAEIGRAFYDEVLYVGSADNIQVYDVTDPENLLLLSTFPVNGKIMDMWFDGDLAYALVWQQATQSDLLVFDVSDPMNVIQTGILGVTSGDAGNMYHSPERNLIYIHGLMLNTSLTVSVVDVGNRANPTLLFSESRTEVDGRMAAYDDFYFLAENRYNQGYLLAYNTAVPDTPQLVTEHQLYDEAVIREISNIDSTLLLHARDKYGNMILISMVWDAGENDFKRGTSFNEGPGVLASRFTFIKKEQNTQKTAGQVVADPYSDLKKSPDFQSKQNDDLSFVQPYKKGKETPVLEEIILFPLGSAQAYNNMMYSTCCYNVYGFYRHPAHTEPIPMKFWTGAKDSNWHDPENWDPPGVPGPDDHVIIPASTDNEPVINGQAECGAMNNFGDVTVEEGGNLTVGGETINEGALNQTGGSTQYNGPVTNSGLWNQENGDAGFSGLVTSSSNWDFAGGTCTWYGNFNNLETGNFSQLDGQSQFDGPVTNSGLWNQENGDAGFSGLVTSSNNWDFAGGTCTWHGNFNNLETGNFDQSGGTSTFHDFSTEGSVVQTDGEFNVGGDFNFLNGQLNLNKLTFVGDENSSVAITNDNYQINELRVNKNDPDKKVMIAHPFSANHLKLLQGILDAQEKDITAKKDVDLSGGTLQNPGGLILSGNESSTLNPGNNTLNDLFINKEDNATVGLLLPLPLNNLKIEDGKLDAQGNDINAKKDVDLSGGALQNPGGLILSGGESSALNPGNNELNSVIIDKEDDATAYLFHPVLLKNFKIEDGKLDAQNNEITAKKEVDLSGGLLLDLPKLTFEGDQPSSLKTGNNTLDVLSVNKENDAQAETLDPLNCFTLNLEGGKLKIQYNAVLDDGAYISGGAFVVAGTSEEGIQILGLGRSNYSFVVEEGATIHAKYATFSGMDANGIYVKPGAFIDPAGAFYNCTFSEGTAGGVLLTIDNDQEVEIENATFVSDSRNAAFNVRKSVDAGSVTFINAAGSFAGAGFEDDPFNRIFWDGASVTQQIELPAGWSGLSSYVMPAALALEDVFDPVSNELIIAQTMSGYYYPGENTNTIGNWPQHAAFKVKTNAACTLPVTGEMEANHQVSLDAGWNLLPVISTNAVSAYDLLSPLDGLVMAKDVAGTGVFWPEYGINTLGSLLPGKAYFVKTNTPETVNYEGLKSSGNVETLTGFYPARAGLSVLGLEIIHTPITHTVAILPSALENVLQGCMIAAFDEDDNCYGAAAYAEDIVCLTIFGDDPLSNNKSGFGEGEQIRFKLINPESGETVVLSPHFSPGYPANNGAFAEHGISVITAFENALSNHDPVWFNNIAVFPNPSSGLVTVSGLVNGSSVTITDLFGQIIFKRLVADKQQIQLDLTGYPAGVYFINAQFKGVSIFQKLILR